jgi:acyl-CoA synthetase (AMP-forming)/AMP-acid ligase II
MSTVIEAVKVLIRSGILRPIRPDKLMKMAAAARAYGTSPAAAVAAAAARSPRTVGIIDEAGSLTYEELHRRSNALANSLRAAGVNGGDHVAVMCRNHRGFVDIACALGKLGAHAVLLNTEFSGPQIRGVLEGESVTAIVYDGEFATRVAEAGTDVARFVAWPGDEETSERSLEDLIAAGDPGDPPTPEGHGRVVILTSGTTGAPKGAPRAAPRSLTPIAALLGVIPLRAHETTVIAAPLFHSWGFAHFAVAMPMSSTMVLRRRFDPQAVLADIAEHRASTLVAVPVMIQRMLAVPDEERRRHDTSSLRVVALSGSQLTGALATRFMDAFGDVIYNLYGSTEVAWATIATPQDLRAAPGTAGRPPVGTTVRILDENGREVPTGQVGRIFVGNDMLFEGYTGGQHKEVVDGLMSSGDVGRFDGDGRLFIEGRDDEMIVSGGENVFPAEVEEVLVAHPAVADVAVVGVDDDEFGQRLKAFVVRRPGAELDGDAVREHVRGNLARYKVPRDVDFVDELPRNATGKVLKRDLRD